MKKIITKATFLLLIVISFSSCVSVNKGFQSSPVISRNIQLDPIKADIKVDANNKLKGESTASYFLMFKVSGDNTFADGINYSSESQSAFGKMKSFASGGRLKKVRSAAAYKALSAGDYDFLVHPNYTSTVEDYLIFKKYTVKVEGYGATYENFRTEKQKIVILEDGKEVILQDN